MGPRLSPRFNESDRDPTGSGIVIDVEKGQVVTAEHVLRGSSRVAVITADGQERLATQVRRDPGFDLAVLVVDLSGLNLTPAKWGDPARSVLAIGC